MNTIQRIVKNSGASLVTRIASPLSSFFLVLFIARYLGTSGLGQYSSAFALFFIFQAFASLGLSPLVTREVSQDRSKAKKYLVNASLLGFISSSLMALVMSLIINLISDVETTINAVYILSLTLIPYTLMVVCQAISRAHERLEYITVSEVAGNIFKVAAGLFVLFQGWGIILLMVVIFSTHLIFFLISLYLALKCIPASATKTKNLDFNFCKLILTTTPVFALILIFGNIRWNIDTIILTKMMGEDEVGLYNGAVKLMSISKLALSCYIMAIQPVMFRLFTVSMDKFKMICEESVRYLFILMVPIAMGVTCLSEDLIILIFKEDFLPASMALQIIIWILIFSGVNLIFANILIASNHQRVNFQANLAAMVVNIILNLLLIPKFSFIGASIASISASLTLLFYQYVYISRNIFRIKWFSSSIKPLISAAVMAFFIVYVLQDFHVFIIIPLAAVIYFLCVFAIKTFSSRDKELLRKLVSG